MSASQVQAYRRTVGTVFQDFKLIPRKTVYDNVALLPRLMGEPETQLRRRALQVLSEVGLAGPPGRSAADAVGRRAAARRRSRARSSTIRRSSSPTSRPATSIRCCRSR